jgi:SAM-dependent methyltransferase
MSNKFILPNGNLFAGCYLNRILFSYMKQHYYSVLDVGCGVGTQLEMLREWGIEELVGCDISSSSLGKCRSKDIECDRVNLDDRDLRLPYASESFDVVMCNQVLEHLKYPSVVVSEMVRVANDLVYITVPAGGSYDSTTHINYWKDIGSIRNVLLQEDLVYSIEVAISKPADVELKYAAFIICIYKEVVSSDNLVEKKTVEADNHPLFIHLGE